MTAINQILQSSINDLKKTSPTPDLDARILLAHALQKPQSFLFSWPEHVPTNEELNAFNEFLGRRQSGEPIAHIIGHKEFWGLDFKVTADTLIPRPETEMLVEIALDKLDLDAGLSILDLGTGSGAIAIALASERPNWQVTATDKSSRALEVAKHNAKNLDVSNIEFFQGSWFNALNNKDKNTTGNITKNISDDTDISKYNNNLNNQINVQHKIEGGDPTCIYIPLHQFHAIISNPPYIDPQDPHLTQGDVTFEPRSALISNNHGLSDLEAIINSAVDYLLPGGLIALEHGYDQGTAVTQLLQGAGFIKIQCLQDFAGHDRISIGCKK